MNEMLEFPSLNLLKSGKVRNIWNVDDKHILIHTTDRVSVFDSILSTQIPGKGGLLTEATRFWCNKTKWIIPNHISRAEISLKQVLPNIEDRPDVYKACQIARKYISLPVEAIVRGFLYGSAWKEYAEYGTVNGEPLPEGMQQAQAFRFSRFTPSTKAPPGEHDRAMSKEEFYDILGSDLGDKILNQSIFLYEFASWHLLKKGFILADTKFEFAWDEENKDLVLIDEVITPDNSRIWRKDLYKTGQNQMSYDKDVVRNYVSSYISERPNEKIDVSKISLPSEVVESTFNRYQQITNLLTHEV